MDGTELQFDIMSPYYGPVVDWIARLITKATPLINKPTKSACHVYPQFNRRSISTTAKAEIRRPTATINRLIHPARIWMIL